MKILIAPWGHPRGWKDVVYNFNKHRGKAKTPLKILQNEINPDKIIIIGLDTIADKGRTYADVKKAAQEIISEYAKKYGIKNYDVLIAPGIGNFPNGKFEGEALDYYYYLFAKLALMFCELEDGILEITLDTTHGINYSTILSYRAVKELLQYISIFKKIKFMAVNSDPAGNNITDKDVLNVNVIESVEVTPVPLNEMINKEKLYCQVMPSPGSMH